GGQVTYHGPGQLVAYTLLDLSRAKIGVREVARRLETAVVLWLGALRIEAYRKPSAPGPLALPAQGEAKLAALASRQAPGWSSRGLALNVAMDLAPFADIDPCGYPGLAVTQLADFGVAKSVDQAGAEFAPFLVRSLTATRST